MLVDSKSWRTIWLQEDNRSIGIIDQTKLPYEFSTCILRTWCDVADAIRNMKVRGAPLIGVTGAFGLMLALQEDSSDESLERAKLVINSTRPTAINLGWALERVSRKVESVDPRLRFEVARTEACLIAEEDVKMCQKIGDFGLGIFEDLILSNPLKGKEEPINVLTHCNAGWLATVDWGTALSPIYKAHRSGLNIHVWVDETRPRNQGASLTTFELGSEGIAHTLIVDNAGGYLMQKGEVDMVIVGTDRTTRSGDVCNKIGTYLKALAARDNGIPFYVALPISTIDFSLEYNEIPIEIRSEKEVNSMKGVKISETGDMHLLDVRIAPEGTKSFNPGFDITPSKLITKFITDRGLLYPNEIEFIFSK